MPAETEEGILVNVVWNNTDTGSHNRFPVRVPQNATVQQVLQAVWPSISVLVPRGETVSDYGLFQVTPGTKTLVGGEWLKESTPATEIGQHEPVEVRKKAGILKVRLLDHTIKTFKIDQTLPVGQILPMICARIGITNVQEYDLTRQLSEQTPLPEEAPKKFMFDPASLNFATLERKLKARDQHKMEELKKKLATDIDTWLEHDKSLIEQGVEPKEVILLKRRYFYSDQTLDVADVVEHNLLYVQCRDAIVNGTHPVTVAQAVQFAGIQSQAEYGDLTENKKSLDVRPMLPRAYFNPKKLDKRLLADFRDKVHTEWSEHKGLSEIQAKQQYIKMAQKLETYGVTFFLVKEKMVGRNKMVPRLFGVSRHQVMRLDEKTKEVLNFWPMMWISRWAVTANTFSLDFGDYADKGQLYSMQTQEGKAIAHLIQGYIDLIKQRKVPEDHQGTIGKNSSITEEYDNTESNLKKIETGSMTTNVHKVQAGETVLPGVIRHTDLDRRTIKYTVAGAQAKLAEIVASFSAVLRMPTEQGSVGVQALEESEKQFAVRMGGVAAAVGQLIQIAGATEASHDERNTQIDRSIYDLIENVDHLALSLRTLAASYRDSSQGTSLLHQAEGFCTSVSDLLATVQQSTSSDQNDPTVHINRQALLATASKLGEKGRLLTVSVEDLDSRPRLQRPHSTNQDLEQELARLVQQIGSCAGDVVRKAKLAASENESSEAQRKMIEAALQVPLRTADVMVCGKLLRMCAGMHGSGGASRKQFLEALERLQQSLDVLAAVSGDLDEVTPAGRHYVQELHEGLDVFGGVIGRTKQCLRQLEEHPVQLDAARLEKLSLEISSEISVEEVLQKGRVLLLAAEALLDKLRLEKEGCLAGERKRKEFLDDTCRTLEELCRQLTDDLQDFERNPLHATKRQAIQDTAGQLIKIVSTVSRMDTKRKLLQRVKVLLGRTEEASNNLEYTGAEASSVAGGGDNLQYPLAFNSLQTACGLLTDGSRQLSDLMDVLTFSKIKDQVERLISLQENTLETGGVLYGVLQETGTDLSGLSGSVKNLDALLSKLLDCLLELDTLVTLEEAETPPENQAATALKSWIKSVDEQLMTIEEEGADDFPVTAAKGSNFTHTIADCRAISNLLELEKGNLQQNLDDIMKFLQSLIDDSDNLTRTSDSQEKMAILNHLKTVLEAIGEFVDSPNDQATKNTAIESSKEYSSLLESLQTGRQMVDEGLPIIDSGVQSVQQAHLPLNRPVDQESATIDDVKRLLEHLALAARNVDLKAIREPGGLRQFGSGFCGTFKNTCDAWVAASRGMKTMDDAWKEEVHAALVDVGRVSTEMLQKAAKIRVAASRDQFAKACRLVGEKIGMVQALFSLMDCGTRSCERFLSTIEEVEEELDTAITFTRLGGFEIDNQNEIEANPPSDTDLLIELQRRVGDLLVALRKLGGASSQRDLADATDEMLRGLLEMVETVKKAAAATSDPQTKVLLLQTLKDTTHSAMAVTASVKAKSELTPGGESVLAQRTTQELQHAQLQAADHLKALMITVHAVRNQNPEFLTAFSVQLKTLQRQLDQVADGIRRKTPRYTEMRAATQQIVVTVKDVASLVESAEKAVVSRKDTDIVLCINATRAAFGQVLLAHQMAAGTSDLQFKASATKAAQECASAIIQYSSSAVFVIRGEAGDSSAWQQYQAQKSVLQSASHALETCLHMAEPTSPPVPFRTSSRTSSRTPSPSPSAKHVSFSDELSGAAANIQQATERLDELKARRSVYIADVEYSESESDSDVVSELGDFGEQDSDSIIWDGGVGSAGLTDVEERIIDFCRAVMTASAALIPAAGAAQAELVKQGRVSSQPSRYSPDSQWSQGFISAAKAVGISCQTLCDAANGLISGTGSQEKLISASRQVASFTAQLLVTCRVKGDANSPTMKNLTRNGLAVRQATDQLVGMLSGRGKGLGRPEIIVPSPEVVVNKQLVGGIAQEIKATEQVSIKEKALVEAQRMLLKSRKAKDANLDELAAQENVLIKERELAQAKAYLKVLQEAKYGKREADDDFKGYGHLDSATNPPPIIRS